MSEQTNDTTHTADTTDADQVTTSPVDNEGQGDETGTDSAKPDNGTEDTRHTPEVDRLLAQLHKKNREAANLRERVAKAEPAAQETQAAAERAERAESERDALLAALSRERVARRFNLPDELAERLKGTTEQEMAADAESLSKLLNTSTRPGRVDVGAGNRTAPDSDPNALFRRLARDAP
jgi:hypothetical protein